MSKQIDLYEVVKAVVENSSRVSRFLYPDAHFVTDTQSLLDRLLELAGLSPEELDALCVKAGEELDAEKEKTG